MFSWNMGTSEYFSIFQIWLSEYFSIFQIWTLAMTMFVKVWNWKKHSCEFFILRIYRKERRWGGKFFSSSKLVIEWWSSHPTLSTKLSSFSCKTFICFLNSYTSNRYLSCNRHNFSLFSTSLAKSTSIVWHCF